MRRLTVVLLLISLLFIFVSCGTADGENSESKYKDDTGRSVTLENPPKRVAVLFSSLADIWLLAGGRVDITVYESCERGFVREDEAVLVDRGAGKTVNTELLVASQPELVILSSDIKGQIECRDTLDEIGIPSLAFNVESFEDYLRTLKIMTEILGTPERYLEYGERVKAEIDEIISDFAEKSLPKILFIRAGSSAGVTKAKTQKNNFAALMLHELGAHNIADDAPLLLDGISEETVVVENPEYIFYTTMGDEEAAVTYMNSLLDDDVWSSVSAVKSQRVYKLPKELFQYKPNARWAEAYKYLAELLYSVK